MRERARRRGARRRRGRGRRRGEEVAGEGARETREGDREMLPR